MVTKPYEYLMATDLLGATHSATQTLVGVVLGIMMFAGLVDVTGDGQLAMMYTPVGLAGSALRLTAIGAVLALLVPYAATYAATGWGVGAVVAVVGAGTAQVDYLLPLLAHVAGALVVLSVSNRIRSG